MKEEPNNKQNYYAIRPVMSLVATGLISSGLVFCNSKDYYGFLLLTAGVCLYLLKAYLYNKGIFS